MSLPPIPYDTFISSNQAFSGDGGPWTLSFGPKQDHTGCQSTKTDWCNGYCLQCRVYPPGELPQYTATYSTNLSINMAQYGSGSKLDFTWTFWPLYCGTGIPSGTFFPIRSQIGDASFDDSIPTVDFNAFDNGDHTWNPASRITHTATATVTRNGATGYLPISISFAMSPTDDRQFLDYYIKGIGLQIRASSQANSPVTLSNSPSGSLNALSPSLSFNSNSNSNTTLLSTLSFSSGMPLSTAPLPNLSPGSGPGTLTLSGFTYPTGSVADGTQVSGISTALVAGVTTAIVAVLAVLLIVFLCLRRRKRQSATLIRVNSTADTEQQAEEPSKTRTSTSPLVTDSCHATTATTVMPLHSVRSKRALSISSSHKALLAGQTRQGSLAPELESEHETARTPSPNLPDLTLGDRADTNHAFSTRPSSVFFGIPYDPSPVYRPEERASFSDWIRPPSPSPALAEFVRRHRDEIPVALEEKLLAAGYLPTDDPSNLTAEQWSRDYGVTRVEYMRLQRLYASRTADQPVSSDGEIDVN